jgi:TRAP-type C4-dicarboxylate transport system permease small subunit
MDIIISRLPPKVREALDLFSELVLIATTVTIAIFAWPVIRDLAAFDQRSQAGDFPLVIPQALVPIGLAIMALLVAVRLLTGQRRSAGH